MRRADNEMGHSVEAAAALYLGDSVDVTANHMAAKFIANLVAMFLFGLIVSFFASRATR